MQPARKDHARRYDDHDQTGVGIGGYDMEQADADVLNRFNNRDQLSDYAADAAATLVRNGLVAGADGALRTKANTTREEVAVSLHRVISRLAK